MMTDDANVRVLLVDDDPDDYLLTQEMLRAISGDRYELDWAGDYDAGIGALRKGEHEVCLLDYRLGARSGLELLREARSEGCAVPIIVLTGNGNGSIERDALAAGAADYLIKGKTDTETLWRALRHALDRTRALEALRERDRLFRAVFDHAWEGMLIAGDDARYVDANPAACRLTGLTRDELLSRSVYDLRGTESRAEVARTWAAFLIGGRQVGQLVLTRPDGDERVVEFTATANILPGKHLTVLHDITEQQKLRSQLAISDRMVSVGTLAAGVAHEINNPLAAVITNLELARKELMSLPAAATASAEPREWLDDAAEAAERVRQTVRDLKLFSRPDEERRGPVDVRRAIESSLRMVWNEIRHRARLVESYAETPSVDANESRLGQVFLNLLINAAQAIPEGRAEQNAIGVTTSTENGRVFVDISDTGCGIPPNKLERIFEPFFTTKPQGVGTGLGLSICHNIVKGLGGELSVTSTLGRGSVFRVSLPIGVLQESPRPESTVSTSAPRPERRARVLLIDDEAILVRAIARTLASRHDVTALTDARDALRRVADGERFDVILCDLMMPQMTGMELHRELSAIAPDLADRMVFITGGAFTPRALEFLDRVPNRRLEKPYQPAALIGLIGELAG